MLFSAHYPPLYPIPITTIACYRLSPAQHQSTAHNKYNHKLTKEITNQSPRAKTLNKIKNLDPCWPYKDQGKTSVDKKPSGIKRPQRKKPKLKLATYCNTNIQDEMSVQIIKLNVLQCTAQTSIKVHDDIHMWRDKTLASAMQNSKIFKLCLL